MQNAHVKVEAGFHRAGLGITHPCTRSEHVLEHNICAQQVCTTYMHNRLFPLAYRKPHMTPRAWGAWQRTAAPFPLRTVRRDAPEVGCLACFGHFVNLLQDIRRAHRRPRHRRERELAPFAADPNVAVHLANPAYEGVFFVISCPKKEEEPGIENAEEKENEELKKAEEADGGDGGRESKKAKAAPANREHRTRSAVRYARVGVRAAGSPLSWA